MGLLKPHGTVRRRHSLWQRAGRGAERVRLAAPMPPRPLAMVGPAHRLPVPCYVAARNHGSAARRTT